MEKLRVSLGKLDAFELKCNSCKNTLPLPFLNETHSHRCR